MKCFHSHICIIHFDCYKEQFNLQVFSLYQIFTDRAIFLCISLKKHFLCMKFSLIGSDSKNSVIFMQWIISWSTVFWNTSFSKSWMFAAVLCLFSWSNKTESCKLSRIYHKDLFTEIYKDGVKVRLEQKLGKPGTSRLQTCLHI